MAVNAKKISVLEFNTRNNNRYIYDGNTSTVLPVDDIIIDCIKQLATDKPIDIIKKELLNKYNDHGLIQSSLKFISEYSLEKKAFYRDEFYENKIRRWQRGFRAKDLEAIFDVGGNMQQLVLNVTEDCNLRCKYCFLSEEYKYTRDRTSAKMSIEVAIKSLDFFFKKMRKIKQFNPAKKCAITFYGGEPLLNFKVIKSSMEYAKENSPVPVIFNITTNGVLLEGDICKYLVDNNVYIAVSLDGSRENHDRNRVFEKNLGSHEVILKNLKTFYERYPKYDKINILSVYDINTDLEENNNFFKENNLPPPMFVTSVNGINTEYYSRFNEEEILRFQTQYNKLLIEYIDKKIIGIAPTTYSDMLFEISVGLVLFRPYQGDFKPPMLPFTGACVPGMKFSVRTDGTFDMCERINNRFPIGDFTKGYNYGAIKDIIKNYNDNVTIGCHECPISKVCPICPAQCCGDKCFEKPNCQNLINTYKLHLSIVYSILEENPKAFDNYEQKMIWFLNS